MGGLWVICAREHAIGNAMFFVYIEDFTYSHKDEENIKKCSNRKYTIVLEHTILHSSVYFLVCGRNNYDE